MKHQCLPALIPVYWSAASKQFYVLTENCCLKTLVLSETKIRSSAYTSGRYDFVCWLRRWPDAEGWFFCPWMWWVSKCTSTALLLDNGVPFSFEFVCMTQIFCYGRPRAQGEEGWRNCSCFTRGYWPRRGKFSLKDKLNFSSFQHHRFDMLIVCSFWHNMPLLEPHHDWKYLCKAPLAVVLATVP